MANRQEINEVEFNLIAFIQYSMWKYFPFTRPQWLKIGGKFIFDGYSKILVSGQSKMIVNGNLDLCHSQIFLVDSTISSGKLTLNNSSLNLSKSDFKSEHHTHFKNAVANVLNSEIKVGQHFRVHHSAINLTETKLVAGDYFFIDDSSLIDTKKASIQIGNNTRLQCALNVSNGNFTVGNNSFINSGSRISCLKNISIGDYVMISYDCVIFDNNSHQTNHLARRQEIDNGFPNGTLQKEEQQPNFESITIGNDVWIGLRSIILKGVTIGNCAVVAASTTVTKDVAKNHLVFGNPNTYKPLE